MTVEQSIGIAATTIQAIAILVTAIFASRTLNAWRSQLVGKRKFEVAEEAIEAFVVAMDAIKGIRGPATFVGEGETRPKEPAMVESEAEADRLNQSYVPIERYKKRESAFSSLHKAQTLCRIHFGEQGAEPFEVLNRSLVRILTSTHLLIDSVQGEKLDPETRKKCQRDIWAYEDAEDWITNEIAGAYKRIQDVCKPHLV